MNNFQTSGIFYFIFFISITVQTIFSQNLTENSFADYLYNRGEYYRAITEYYRLIYNCADLRQKIILLKQIGLSYYQGEDYENLIDFLENNRMSFQRDSLAGIEMDFLLAKGYYKSKNFSKTITTLEWKNNKPGNKYYFEYQFLLGISYARLFKEKVAIEKMYILKKIDTKNEMPNRFIDYFQKFENIPQKSRFLAGALSAILPGSGYLYCDRPGTGLTSFIINGLLIWSVRDAFKNKQYGLASAALFFGFGWYLGNINGSVDAAEIYNSKIQNKYINDFLKKEQQEEYLLDD